ncbi:MAG: ATP-binding protein [bacterium]|nr:ATP-binding protein [bacterium]
MPHANRRRKATRRNIILMIILLVLINFIGWVFYLSIRETLDDEFGYRLVYIANTAALFIDGTMVSQLKSGDETKPEYIRLRTQLNKIKNLNGLREIFIINRHLQTLVDANTTIAIGYPNRLLEIDAAEIDSAYAGQAQSSILYTLKQNFYKRGYAPIRNNENQVVAVLGIEAGADFARVIFRIRNSLLVLGLISVVLIIATITTMNRIYTTLWHYEEQVLSAEKFRAVGQLAAGVAHEIRNPLGIIRGTAELLKDDVSNQENVLNKINDILHEVDRMNQIISNFLDFSKTMPIKVTEQDINAVLEKALQLCQYQLEQSNIIIQKNYSEQLPAVNLDTQQMTQVFLNLILNARDAMPKGGTLTLTTTKKGNKIIIEISDSGCGIPATQLSRLFEPFYSTKPDGIGLGLTISKRIIEDHHGEIEIESAVNKGTTVRIILPQ